ncbi:hypothetical protein ACSBR2_030296 [Camellia fascicularis]
MFEEFCFCQILEEENSSFNDTTHRLSMHTRYCNMDKVMESIGKSPVSSVFLFQVGELPKKPILGTLAANFKLLKVLDLQCTPLDQLHKEVGNLFLLRYLSIRSTEVKIIPKSIGSVSCNIFLPIRMQPNQGKDYWIIERIPQVSIWSQFENIGNYQICNLQEYFDEKVANQRVTEAENESQSSMPIQCNSIPGLSPIYRFVKI